MEETARQILKNNYPIKGFNLYLMAYGQKKRGKTYELLLKMAMLKALNEVYALNLEKSDMIDLICQRSTGSVLDTLYLGQIASEIRSRTEQQKTASPQL